jgi:hypothetical protein
LIADWGNNVVKHLQAVSHNRMQSVDIHLLRKFSQLLAMSATVRYIPKKRASYQVLPMVFRWDLSPMVIRWAWTHVWKGKVAGSNPGIAKGVLRLRHCDRASSSDEFLQLVFFLPILRKCESAFFGAMASGCLRNRELDHRVTDS